MNLFNRYRSWRATVGTDNLPLLRRIEFLFCLTPLILGMVWVMMPSKDALNRIEHNVVEIRHDVKHLQDSVSSFSKRLSAVEKQNLALLEITTGPIPLGSPSKKKQMEYRARYRAFVKAELGALPKPKQYWAPAMRLPASEMRCLALNIYHEAAKEPSYGMVAVGQVTMNRFQLGRWGNICDTVYSKAQFSWTLDKKRVAMVPSGKLWERSKKVARDVARGLRVEGLENAVFYHADYIPAPKWITEVKVRHVLGRHLFYDQRV